MKQRCLNPKFRQFSDYGGRGVTICDRWIHSFENFLADMGVAPEGRCIDRIDNSKGYEPGNCQWTTQAQQMRNTRRNHLIEFKGFSGCLTDACIHFNIPRQTVFTRLRRGWTVEEAFSTPNGKYVRR